MALEWEPFRLIEDGSGANASAFSHVYHIAHVETATRICADGKIKSSRISDESLMRRSDISVVWVSPNHYKDGSLYGNIRFKFEWEKLWRDKKVYWVEVASPGNSKAL